MPLKQCSIKRCTRREGLLAVEPLEEELCAVLLCAHGVAKDWRRKPNGKTVVKTYLCEAHYPREVASSRLGARVARVRHGRLEFGEVWRLSVLSHERRRQEEAVLAALAQPEARWAYRVQWPHAEEVMSGADIEPMAELSRAVDEYASAKVQEAMADATRKAGAMRGQAKYWKSKYAKKEQSESESGGPAIARPLVVCVAGPGQCAYVSTSNPSLPDNADPLRSG